MVSINEKSKLIKIIQKEQLTEEDKEELRHILSKLPSKEFKSLLGKVPPEVLTASEERYKIPSQEKELIKQEFSNGIPIQRLKEIISTHKDEFEDDFIERIQSFYDDVITNNRQRLFLSSRKIDKIISGYRHMLYGDNALSKKSIRKLELLIGRSVPIIEDWRKPYERHLSSGEKIQILPEGIELLKYEMKLGILIQRLSNIIDNYNLEDDFIQNVRRIYEDALISGYENVKIPIDKLNEFIKNYRGIIYYNNSTSRDILNKLQMLVDKPIPHKIVYGIKKMEPVLLIKNDLHAEFIGTFIMKGNVYFKPHHLTVSFNKDSHPKYIAYLESLIASVFKETPILIRGSNDFFLSGEAVSQYFKSQGLSNTNKKVPSWIKKPLTWIRENPDEWRKKYLPLVVACLKGMINATGWIGVQEKWNRIRISLTRSNRTIIEDFRDLCTSLDIKTTKISEITDKRPNRSLMYHISINAAEHVRRFLIDIVKPMKWDLIRDDLQKILKKKGTSIEDALEISHELRDLRRQVFKHQQRYTFQYHPIRIKQIKNPTLRKRLQDYIENISFKLYPYNAFQIKTNIRPSSLKLRGNYQERINTSFIKAHLVDNLLINGSIKKYSYDSLPRGPYLDLLNLVRQIFTDFRIKYRGITPPHPPILKRIMIKLPSAKASEIPVWSMLKGNEYCVGHIDLFLADEVISRNTLRSTLYIADLKADETDIIRSLPQIVSYGVMLKNLIFKTSSDFKAFDLKCIMFTKDEVWEFEPDSLKYELINFIKYANSIRNIPLKSLSFSKGLSRTDLLKDIEKVVAFLQSFFI